MSPGRVVVLGALCALLSLSPALASPPVYCELPGLGMLQGHVPSNTTFKAFEGIPYARPPTGPLRFQPPQPSNWFALTPRVYNARFRRHPCPYLSDEGRLVGTEDCLYLNVYTTQVDDELKMPVLVVLPGDDWTWGYGGRWRPHRLMDKDIVVVTVQSRLGALGFLSTGDSTAPGNLGLKDERLALQWVRQHIHRFGGDPNRITLAGVGAGAAAVMLHTLSNPGLFQRAIAISGSALSPWSLTENTQEAAVAPTRRLAEAVGCDCPVFSAAAVTSVPASTENVTAAAEGDVTPASNGNVTVSSANATASATSRPANLTEILECLRSKPVKDIVYGTASLQGWAGLPTTAFGPVLERADANGSFLSAPPAQLWAEEPSAVTVPLLLGLSRGEGLQLLASGPSGGLLNNTAQLRQLDAEWPNLAPALFAFNTTPATDRVAAAEQIRRQYLGVVTPADAKDGLVRLFGDRHVVLPALRAAALHARRHPVYLYRFAWSAAEGSSPLGGPWGGSDATLLLMEPLPTEAVTRPAQRAMALDILDLWSSFIDTGVPALGNTTVPRATSEPLPFLDLVRPGVHKQGNWSLQETVAFWEGLPLLENQKPSAPVTAKAGGLTDPRKAASTAPDARRSTEWPLLTVALGIACWLQFQAL